MPISIDVADIANPAGVAFATAEATLLAQGATVVRRNVVSSSVLKGLVISHTVEHLAVTDATDGTLRPVVTLNVSAGLSIGGTGFAGSACIFWRRNA